VSLITLAAPLIRQAAADETYQQDLHDSVADESAAREGLVYAAIDTQDLGWLSPSEWQWFARWRQSMGGMLDTRLLEHLAFTATSRSGRFELRGLVMRDPHTEERAPTANPTASYPEAPGLQWLQRHALEFPDSFEVARDALQYATRPAWFTLRVLTSHQHERGEQTRAQLRDFARERELSPEITSEWSYNND